MAKENIILFDTETTGLLKPEASDISQQPSITEIYCCKIDEDGNFLDDFESLINPGVPISEEITKITGIDDEMVKASPTFAGLYPALAEFFLGTKTMVAHNLRFDRDMLKYSLRRIGREHLFPWPIVHHCTIELSRPIARKMGKKRLRLTHLHEELMGKPHDDGAHRAKADVMALTRCYLKMKGEYF